MNKIPNYNKAIVNMLGIELPIIQAGMIWASGWQLASAVSNAGGLGVIGAGSMYPHILQEHVAKCKAATKKPFAVNLPLLYPQIEEHITTIIENEVPVVITSAGSPKTWTKQLQAEGIIVIHVVSSSAFAIKSQDAGVDAVIAEGFEAGGHNGREETTTMCLIPAVCEAISIPVVAAGGIACGKTMAAAMMLGAAAVQIGSRYVATEEASSHGAFKEKIIQAQEGDTKLMLKELTPVRLLKNEFAEQVQKAEQSCATKEELIALLGKGRAKQGMFEGNLENGELEIGQVAARIKSLMPASELTQQIWKEFVSTVNQYTS